jgi:hypothetical protein
MVKKLAVAFLFVSSVVFAMAEQVTLKNGDRLTGDILSMDGKKLVIKTQASAFRNRKHGRLRGDDHDGARTTKTAAGGYCGHALACGPGSL